MPRRPCLDCGALHRNSSRCDSCQARWDNAHEQRRGSATARGYGYSWQQTSKQVLAEHQRNCPDLCPGWRRPAHYSDDLTVDHIIPKAKGGTDARENLQVLCRPCNAAKAADLAEDQPPQTRR